VVTIEPDFSVTDAPVRVPNMEEPLEGGVMVLSLPMLRLLTADEAACIVAHELGHLAEPASKAQSDWRTLYSALVAETDRDRRIWHSPTNWHLGLLPALFKGAVAETLRQEEVRADKVALRVAQPQTAVAAFLKTIVAQEALEIHANINFDRLEKGAVLDNLSTEAVDLILKVLTTIDPPKLVERVRRLEIGRVEGPTIERRIGNFGYSLDDAAALLKSHPHQGEPAPVGDLRHLEECATRNVHRFQQVLADEQGPLPLAEVESMTAFLKG
jgi:Zn-dependent protease with chaperone function